jgi:ribose transport system substrate-binding protein
MTEVTRRFAISATGSLVLGMAILPKPAAAASITFALVQINQQALFFNQINEGAQQAAKKAGVDLVIFNANDKPSAQNDAIETYTQQKVQGIIAVAIDVNGIMPAVQSAAAAGIPVVAVDAILPAGPQQAQIGVDNAKAGEDMGKFFADYVKSNMGGKAKLGIVGALNSFRTSAILSRSKGVFGDGLQSRTDPRRAIEVGIAVDALNRMLELGRPEYVRLP